MNNRDYWAKREEENLKHYLKDEKEYEKQVQKIYTRTLANVQKEINAFYGNYAKKENISLAEAKKRVSTLDIKAYEAKAEQYVKDRTFSKQANAEMRLYNATMKINRLEMLKANIGLELIAGHDDLEKFMEGILKGRTEEELKRQAGILGKTITNNAQIVHSIVNASFHNAKFSDRIWMYQTLLKNDLETQLSRGMIQGKNPRELARGIKERFDVRTSDAERLMRTELARVQTEAQKQSFIRNGFSQYMFIVNGGCCDICEEIKGKIYNVKDMQPGENAPPMHPYCRCSIAAYEDSKEYDAWLDFLDKGGTTIQWNEFQTRQKAGSSTKYTYENKEVYFDESNDYSIKLEGYSENVNKGLSEAAISVAKKGSKDRCEHMHLVNLKTGEVVYYETNGVPDSVGVDFWKFVREHKDIDFAFIHNHNVVSSLSESDLTTPVVCKNVPVQIAVQNDGVKYIAQRTKDPVAKFYPDIYYESALADLNKMSRSGKINAIERLYERERIVIEQLLTEFYEKGMEIDNGKNAK